MPVSEKQSNARAMAIFSYSIFSFHACASYHFSVISRQSGMVSGVTRCVLKSGCSASKRLQWFRLA